MSLDDPLNDSVQTEMKKFEKKIKKAKFPPKFDNVDTTNYE